VAAEPGGKPGVREGWRKFVKLKAAAFERVVTELHLISCVGGAAAKGGDISPIHSSNVYLGVGSLDLGNVRQERRLGGLSLNRAGTGCTFLFGGVF
jgi:hypothetical protein